MFGYASDETDVLMPAPITYAHRLVERQSECVATSSSNGCGPTRNLRSLSAMTVRGRWPVDAVVLSTQHNPDISLENLREAVIEEIIKPVLPAEWLSGETKYFINPTGKFVIGGPVGDCGLTGRKIIVDTYGGMARHGGGAFSGKDPSKVDRSAAYAGRWVAKNIVAAELAKRCEIQVSYAIGVAEPTSISLNCFGTETVPIDRIIAAVRQVFDLRPFAISARSQLLPIYRATSTYGHFGKAPTDISYAGKIIAASPGKTRAGPRH